MEATETAETTAVERQSLPDLFLLLMLCKCLNYALLVCKYSLCKLYE